MSRGRVNAIRNTAASNDAVTFDSSGNTAIQGNLTVSGTIPAANLTGALPAISGASLTNLPGGGKVLQVLSVFKDDVFSTTGSTGNFADITGLSVAITPSATTSKILIQFQSCFSTGGGDRGSFRMLRDSTVINEHGASGNTNGIFASLRTGDSLNAIPVAGVHLDSPSTTSATTYKLQVGAEASAGDVYVNRPANNYTGSTFYRGVSNLVVMEIGA